MAEEKKSILTLDKLLLQLEKAHGRGSVQFGDTFTGTNIDRWPVSSPLISHILGGGLPKGRVIEIYGPESCLDSNTFISYEIRDSNGKRQNHKGGSIKRLYERFHNIHRKGSGYYQRAETKNSIFYVSSINDNNCVFKNLIADVVFTGLKECFHVRTVSGQEIVCTEDHKFFNGSDYVSLKDLIPNDMIYVHLNTPNKKEKKQFSYLEVCVKYHPNGRKKIITANDRKGNKKYAYLRYRVRKSHLVFEASYNNMSYDGYVNILNSDDKEKIDKLWTIPTDKDIHHKDTDIRNDTIDNLELTNKSEHYRVHAIKNHNNLRFITTEDRIESIVPVGYKETYDIKCFIPYNNYIANKFVVHNSGKTSLACYLAGEAQKAGEVVEYIDAEFAAELDYAESMGLDRNKLLLSQPSSGEESLQIALETIESGLVKVIIIDSVSALTPQAEIDGEMGDQQMGAQARLMGKGLRKLAPVCGKMGATILFINQIRMKIGIMFGSPETTSGGQALKFYSSVRLEVRKVEFLTKGTEPPYGLITRITAKKNKTAPPYRKGEAKIVFGQGFQFLEEYADFAVQYDIINKGGSWYTFTYNNIEERIQGKEKLVKFMVDNPKYAEYIKDRVDKILYPEPEKETKEQPKKRKAAKTTKTVKKEDNIELPIDEKENIS